MKPLVIDLYGIPTLIMHGDTLCTDDVEYLKFRAIVRSKQWQDHFLNLSIPQRIEQAQALREASKQATVQKTEYILDVNQGAVLDAMQHYKCFTTHSRTHTPYG